MKQGDYVEVCNGIISGSKEEKILLEIILVIESNSYIDVPRTPLFTPRFHKKKELVVICVPCGTLGTPEAHVEFYRVKDINLVWES